MIDDFFLKLLCDPFQRQPLSFNERHELVSVSGKAFAVVEGIPILLPDMESAEAITDELHASFNNKFHYLEHYAKDAETFDYFTEHDSAVTRNEINRLEEMIAATVPAKSEVILDVGCGNGWVAKKFCPAKKVISMDIAITNVAKSLKQTSKGNYGLVADVYNLPVKDNSIDCIIAAEIMEHVVDPKLFIEKLVGALKPGGKLIITTPFNEKIEYYLCVHCNKPTPKNAHLHSFNRENIKAIAPAASIISTFHNKYMLKLRSYLITRFMPLAAWRLSDKIANAVFQNPGRLMIEYVK